MAGSAHVSAALAAFAVLSTLFTRGDAQCYTAAPDCSGASVGLGTAEGCCVGDGVSYNSGSGCQRCYVIGYTEGSRVQTIAEGVTSTLFVEVVKPAIGVDNAANAQTLNFEINNSENVDDVRIGGQSRPTGSIFSGPFVRIRDFQIRAEADQIGQEGDEVFQISLSASPGTVPVFVSTPNAIITVEDTSEVIVELTEADYQMREGFGDALTARVSYSRELANPITVRFFPVTYDRYENVLGLTLPSDFPSIDIRASEADFNGASITVTIPRPGGGFPRQVEVEVPFVNDEINEFQETYVGYIVIDDAVDRDTIVFQRTATQLIINDNDDIAIGFAETSYTFLEGASNPSVVLRKDSGRISERTDIAVMVDLSGTFSATRGPDFEVALLSTRIDFAPNEQEETISLTIVDDNLPEGLESFRLTVTSVELGFGPRSDTFATTEVFITDNDAVEVGLEQTLYEVQESAGSQQVCARVTNPPNDQPLPSNFILRARTVELLLANSADQGDDFTVFNQPLPQFDDSNRRRCFSIGILEDVVYEDSENFQVSLSQESGSEVTINPMIATITILDLDPLTIGLAQTAYTVAETVGFLSVFVEVKSGVVGRNTVVTLSTSDGTAEEPDDYRETIAVLTFEPGFTQVPTLLQIIDDNILEDIENFRLSLETTEPRVTLDPEQGTVSIRDTDMVSVGFEQLSYDVNENGGTVQVCAVITGEIESNVIVDLQTSDGTAEASRDYTALNTELTFVAPSTRACQDINILNDQLYEVDENFFGELTSSNSRVVVITARRRTTVEINDEESLRIGFTAASTAVRVVEGNTARLCARVLSGNIGRDIPIQFSTADGTATAGSDYVQTSTQLDFSAATGNSELCVNVATVENNQFESEEQFRANLQDTNNLPRLTVQPNQATVTIEDDDDIAVTIGFVETSYTVVEGEGSRRVDIEVRVRTGTIPPDRTVEVTFSTSDRTASAPNDYTRVTNRRLQFTDTTTSITVPVSIADDSDIEDVEQFIASLTVNNVLFPAVTVDPAQATVNIISNDVRIGFVETEFTVSESESGVTLELAVLEGTISRELGNIIVTLSTNDRTASGNQDYSGISGQQITFDFDSTGFNIPVPIINDVNIEPTEQFIATVTTSASGVVLQPSQAVINILDDDVVIGFDEVDYTVDEDAGTVQLFVSVQDGTIPVGVTRRITLTTSDRTASSPGDYTNVFSEVLTFTSSSSSDSVTVTIRDDTDVEGLENFVASLSVNAALNPGVRVEPASADITIRDNDVVIGFENPSLTVNERGNAVLFVTLRDGTILPGKQYVVTLTTSDGTADEGDDYQRTTRTLTFSPGTTSLSVSVPITEDNDVEGMENFFATLTTNDDDVTLDPDRATIEIIDDDLVIGFERTVFTVNEGSTVSLVAEVMEGVVTQTVVVSLSTEDGTAASPGDYTDLTNQLLTFREGTTQVSVTVRTNNDDNVEPQEQFSGSLSVNTNVYPGVTIRPGTATIDIIDTDTVRIVLEESEYRVNENDGQREVCAILQPPDRLQRPLEATLSTRDGTAEAGEDYTSADFTITFNEGINRVCRNIVILNDDEAEPQEQFVVILQTNDPQATTGPPNQADVIIMDNDRVRIGFERTEYSVREDAGQIQLVVRVLDGVLSDNVRVRLETEDGSATRPADYTSTTRTLTFGPSTTRLTVAIPISNDRNLEDLENLFANLELLTTDLEVEVRPERAEIEIEDFGDGVEIGLERTLYSAREDDGTVEVCARLTRGALQREVEVELTMRDDTATSSGSNRDYVSSTVTLTFDASNDRRCFDIPIDDDDNLENNEQFTVSLTTEDTEVTLRPNRGEVIINNDDDVTIGFERTSYTEREDGGSVRVCAVVTDGGFLIPVMVRVNSIDGSATSQVPIDFSGVLNQALTFQPGSTRECIDVDIIADGIDEEDEDFTLILSTTQDNVLLNPETTRVVIEDVDDIVIGFERTNLSVGENDGTVQLCTLIRNGGQLERTVRVDISTQPGTAEAGVDYTSVRRTTLTFSGSLPTRQCTNVPIMPDNRREDDESFTATLDRPSPGVVVDPGRATVIIQDETELTFGFERTVYPGVEGMVVNVCVVLEAPGILDTQVVLRATSEDISAIAPGDYISVDTQLTFAAGSQRQCLDVTLNGDDELEELEQLRLRLSTNEDRVNLDPETTVINVINAGGVIIGLEEETYSVVENEGDLEVCAVVVRGSVVRDVTVVFETQPRTAIGGGEDYDSVTADLLFNADSTRVCTRIPITNDDVDEDDELFVATLSTEDPDISLAPDEADITIIDNDAVTIGLERTSQTVAEDDGTEEVCAVIQNNGQLQRSVRVILSTQPGSALANVDYSTLTETLMFDASNTRQCVQVAILPDDDLEDDEQFTVTLTSPPDESVVLDPDRGTITIVDTSEVVIGFNETEYTVGEVDGTVRVCAIVMSGRISKRVDVTFTSGDPGTATRGTDYSAGSITLPFNASVAVICVDVGIVDDSIAENSETFTVRIGTTEPRVTLRPDEGEVTIVDNDPITPEFEEPDYTVPENDGPIEVCMTIPAGQLERNQTVTLTTADRTATGGVDYRPQSFEVTFTSGSTRVCTEIVIPDDPDPEADEKFEVMIVPNTPLVDPGTNANTIVCILDNDIIIGFVETEYSVDEGETVTLNVAVLQGEPSGDVIVRLNTQPGSALFPLDYASPSLSTLTFGPTSTRQTVTIPTVDDNIDEILENFLANLSLLSAPDGDNVQLQPDEARIFIADNDGVRIGFEQPVYMVDEDGRTVTVYVAVLDSLLSSEVVVAVNTLDGSATSSVPSDYDSVSNELLTFSPDVTRLPVIITIVDDDIVESVENFFADLNLITTGADVELRPEQTEIRIRDNDVTRPRFEPPSLEVPESDPPVEVCVVVDEVLEREVNVTIRTSDKTATAGEDYAEQTFVLTFTPEISRLCRNVRIINDTIVEPTEETFCVEIPPSPDVDPDPPVTITITDNDAVIGFENTTYVTDENSGRVIVNVVVLEGKLFGTVLVGIRSRDFTAQSPADYISVDTTLTFNPSTPTVPVTITVNEDNIDERVESFFKDLSLISTEDGEVVLRPILAECFIRDIPPAQIGFEQTEYNVDEENGTLTVFVRVLDGELTSDVDIELNTVDDSATSSAPSDYTAITSRILSFGPSTSRIPVTINIINDDVAESLETLFATLTLGTAGANVLLNPDRTRININDRDRFTPDFELPEYTIPEENGPVVVCIIIPQGQLERNAVATFITMDRSARGGQDYISQSFELTFVPGTTRTCPVVPIVDDGDPEDDETFVVEIRVPGIPTNPTTTVTIIDNDEECRELSDPPFGTVSITGRTPSSTGTYQCNTGFLLVGQQTRTCVQETEDTADWSGEEPVCQPICNDLTNPAFGTVTVSSRTVSSTATYQCNSGYRLVGTDTRQCEEITPASAEWSGQAPICQPICDDLTNPAFGTVTVSGQTVSSTATYQCNSGYRLVGTDMRLCEEITPASAEWSGQAPICQPICDDLTNPAFGTVTVSGQTVSSTATYQCNSGYRLVGTDTRLCEGITPTSAEWSGQAPICQPICDDLTNPAFGTVTVSSRTVSSTATYQCNSGYRLVGTDTRLCEETTPASAEWSGQAPICQPICDDLTNPAFGTVTVSGRTVSSTATYQCNSGYSLVGTLMRLCEEITPASAEWSGQAPICERVTVRFVLPSYTFTESGVMGTIEIIKSGTSSSSFRVRVSGGPSNQPNIERSASGINEVITFQSGLDAPDTISVQVNLTDDDVALEDVERYFASLSLVDSTSGVLIVQPERTQINVLDDDVVTVQFGRPSASFNESDGLYRMCIVKDRDTASRVTVSITDTPVSANRDEDYRPLLLRLISIEPDDDRTCFAGTIIDDVIGLEGSESFYLSIQPPTQDRVRVGLNLTNIIIIDDDIVTTNVITPIVNTFERSGRSQICADKDIETAQQVVVTITTSPGKAQQIVDYVGGDYSILLGTEANAQGCTIIPIVVDNTFEDLENFYGSLSAREVNVVVGPDDTSTVFIDDLDDVVNDTLIGDPLLTVPLQEQSLVAVSDIRDASLCYEIHGKDDSWFNIVSDGCVSVNAHYYRFDNNFNFVDRIAIRAVDEQMSCKNILIDLEGCTASIDGVAVSAASPYCLDGVFVRPIQQRNRVRISVPNCNETSNLVMWTICQRNTLMDPFDMMRTYTVDMIKFVIARGLTLGASSHGIIGQFWNIPIDVTLYNGPAADADIGQRYMIQVSHPESDPRIFTGLLAPYTWEHDRTNCFYAGNRQGGTIQEVEDPNDSVIEGSYTDYQTDAGFSTAFKFSHFDEERCSIVA